METVTNDILRDRRRLMVLVPHPDDEILLAAGLLWHAKKRGLAADVVMATNGDCGCRDYSVGRTRLRESLAGLGMLGLSEEQFHILGYADTGMPEADSFLTRLYRETDPHREFASLCGGCTYGLETKPEYHVRRFGSHGRYCRETFRQDLREILLEKRPDCIVTTFPYDLHGDHSALFAFVCETLWGPEGICTTGKPGEKDAYSPELYAGPVHFWPGDESWPGRGSAYYDCPNGWRNITGEETWAWQRRISVPVPEEMRLERGAENLKLRALLQYETALEPGARDFLLSFVKDEEIFWKVETGNEYGKKADLSGGTVGDHGDGV